MKKYICFVIHTERLHDDRVWKRIKKLLSFFKKFNIRANWFLINPAFSGYRAMGFDEEKWKERLKILVENNQSIEQHTHFYKGKKGVPKGEGYDLSEENILKRIREDREWLKNQGFEVKGFTSGAWKINEEILGVLAKEGYRYDLSFNNFNLDKNLSIKEIGGILEIPATTNIKRLFWDLIRLKWKRRILKYKDTEILLVHFHDFDLKDFFNYWILFFLIKIFSIFNFEFVNLREFYERNFTSS